MLCIQLDSYYVVKHVSLLYEAILQFKNLYCKRSPHYITIHQLIPIQIRR